MVWYNMVEHGMVAPAICESFLHENLIFHQFVKVFSLESFLLYSIMVWYRVRYYGVV